MVFPEYQHFFSDVFNTTSRQLLEQALVPQDFVALDLAVLTQLIRQASRGYYGEAKAREIQTIAQQSIGLSSMAKAARVELDCLLTQLTSFEDQVKAIDTAMGELVESLPDTYLTTIPGIGATAAAIILGEIGDVQRFEYPEQLIAYAGIDPTLHKSGQFVGTRARMSKRGSPQLRRILWLAATMARIKDPELNAFYQKKRAEGKSYGTAMGAVCRKLLVRIFVILREKRLYVVRDVSSQPDPIPA